MSGKEYFIKDTKTGISIEIRIFYEEVYKDLKFQDVCTVISHPHPLYGGNMHNNVVFKVKDYLINKGKPCAIFNFRGVGKSTGEFDNCHGEQEDLMNVIRFIQDKYSDIKKIILIGYSFGAVITQAVANSILNNLCTILIAYPFDFIPEIQPDYDLTRPTLFIQGKFDDISIFNNFERHYSKFKGEKQYKVVESDHFFIGSEHELGKIVLEFINLVIK